VCAGTAVRAYYLRMAGRRVLLLPLLALLAACESNTPPPSPSPGPDPGGQTITGRERLGWDQTAATFAELATFRYAIYVDDIRSVVAGVSCEATAGPAGFACSGQLPPMNPGSHVLEVAAFYESNGIVESPRSAPLRVTVAGATAPANGVQAPPPPPLAPGEIITTSDGVRLEATVTVDGLQDVVDLTVLPGGTLLVAERAGAIAVGPADAGVTPLRLSTGASLMSVDAAPDFTANGHLFVVHEESGALRLTRYRLIGTQLAERVRVIRDVPSGREAASSVRSGPDLKLYAAFGSDGDVRASTRPSEWRGKILRLNPDGSTPDDQPAASPVHWDGLAVPRGMAWSSAGVLWLVERGHDGIERLRAIGAEGNRPRRAGLRASYVLPGDPGATTLAFHHGGAPQAFAGDLFVAARRGGYLLRIQFEDPSASTVMTSEKLLEGRVGEVRAVRIGADGAIYVATPSTVWKLSVQR
jgi:glucose/arabinose dehydrogenase